MRIPAGTIIIFTSGEYSDYRYNGPVRVVKDFDQAEVSEEFRGQWKPEYEWEPPTDGGFVAWLIKVGYVEDFPAKDWFVGAYGFEPDIWPEPTA